MSPKSQLIFRIDYHLDKDLNNSEGFSIQFQAIPRFSDLLKCNFHSFMNFSKCY